MFRGMRSCAHLCKFHLVARSLPLLPVEGMSLPRVPPEFRTPAVTTSCTLACVHLVGHPTTASATYMGYSVFLTHRRSSLHITSLFPIACWKDLNILEVFKL
jgi:hypothetical protein